MFTATAPLAWAAPAAMAFLTLSLALGFLRLVMGPTLPDRIVALDLVGYQIIAIIVVYSIWTEQPILLDVAVALALVAFVGTVAFARYLERSRDLERPAKSARDGL